MLDLFTSQVEDLYSRENFFKLGKFISEHPLVGGEMVLREITFTAAATDFPYKHGLKFVPKDFLITRQSVPVTINYEKTDTNNVYFSPSGAGTIRILMGNMER